MWVFFPQSLLKLLKGDGCVAEMVHHLNSIQLKQFGLAVRWPSCKVLGWEAVRFSASALLSVHKAWRVDFLL